MEASNSIVGLETTENVARMEWEGGGTGRARGNEQPATGQWRQQQSAGPMRIPTVCCCCSAERVALVTGMPWPSSTTVVNGPLGGCVGRKEHTRGSDFNHGKVVHACSIEQ
jgi:hypothetical protein